MKKALLLSGGMDSIAVAYWTKPDISITVNYGQRAAQGEVRAAQSAADVLGIEHHIIHTDLSSLGSGSMAGLPALELAPIPEWWPFRNQMLVTLAAMYGLSLGINCILIGCIKSDAQHKDGTASFIRKMDKLLQSQEGKMTLKAPAIELDAVELIRQSGVPIEILAWAHSCHVGEYACGLCRGCRKHYETIQAIGEQPY